MPLGRFAELNEKNSLHQASAFWDRIIRASFRSGAPEDVGRLPDDHFLEFILPGDFDFDEGDLGDTFEALTVQGIEAIGAQRLEREKIMGEAAAGC